ncbi:MAG: c-type cytochrome [Betaproteobacteria bacterium]
MRVVCRIAAVAVAACGMFAVTGAVAQQADVLKAKGCLGCHDMEKKKAGPAFKEVAAKNQGKADQLVAKIKDAKGHPKVNASEADIKAAVDQVLAAK